MKKKNIEDFEIETIQEGDFWKGIKWLQRFHFWCGATEDFESEFVVNIPFHWRYHVQMENFKNGKMEFIEYCELKKVYISTSEEYKPIKGFLATRKKRANL